MSETPVSFVVGGPDPSEELETEDSFPGQGNDGYQQQPSIVPGLVERRKRLRWNLLSIFFFRFFSCYSACTNL